MKYPSIADIIIGLKNEDLQLREKLIQTNQLGHGYNEEMEKLHRKNAEVLNTIIDQIAYPTIDKVGKDANEAAWLVIQHSIGQPDFMKKCARLLEDAVHDKKAKPIHLAYPSDRIAVYEGSPQHYGTQFDWDENGELSPYPFDDLTKVNQRRKSIGLNSLEEQTTIIRRQSKIEKQNPPSNIIKRKEEFEKWRKAVGWKSK